MTENRNATRHTDSAPPVPREERFRAPHVDIYETEDALILLADMPGVTEKGLDVSIEEDVLALVGRVEPQPGDARTLYAEYETLPFRRIFTLSQEIRRDGIEGNIRNGVLRLTLPKAEEARVRKVPIKTQ
jgi:HSP20 family molecular chaperone IbpA